MEQIITLQISRKDDTPANEYNWAELLKLNEDESVTVIDHWMIRGTLPPSSECQNKCKKDEGFVSQKTQIIKCKKEGCSFKCKKLHGESDS